MAGLGNPIGHRKPEYRCQVPSFTRVQLWPEYALRNVAAKKNGPVYNVQMLICATSRLFAIDRRKLMGDRGGTEENEPTKCAVHSILNDT